jgi:hypothetical protein
MLVDLQRTIRMFWLRLLGFLRSLAGSFSGQTSHAESEAEARHSQLNNARKSSARPSHRRCRP